MNNPTFKFQIDITGFISNIYNQSTPVQNGKYVRGIILVDQTKTSPRWIAFYITGDRTTRDGRRLRKTG